MWPQRSPIKNVQYFLQMCNLVVFILLWIVTIDAIYLYITSGAIYATFLVIACPVTSSLLYPSLDVLCFANAFWWREIPQSCVCIRRMTFISFFNASSWLWKLIAGQPTFLYYQLKRPQVNSPSISAPFFWMPPSTIMGVCDRWTSMDSDSNCPQVFLNLKFTLLIWRFALTASGCNIKS